MSAVEVDLKTLLEQVRQMVLELLELSRKLILDLGTAHHWTTRSLDVFHQLNNIGTNLDKLIAASSAHFGDTRQFFGQDAGVKLWKTALGLWRALPPERARLNEQLAKRRRQRIMGDKVEDAGEFSKEIVEDALARYRELCARLEQQYRDLGTQIDRVPAGLSPSPEELAAPPAAAAEAAVAPPAPAPAAAPLPAAAPAQPEPLGPGADEISPA